jgi:MFS family permease
MDDAARTDVSKPVWRRVLLRNVVWLGVVSCLTDVASEMVYPLLPMFLAGLVTVQGAAVYVGLMDGIAETTAGLLKLLSGRWSDRSGLRKPWALGGYGLSTVIRPLGALATAGWHVVGLRFLDRIGKGLRTSPRDALLAATVDADVRGLAFSFHRMMDHIGAVTGPLVALAILSMMVGEASLWKAGPATDAGTMHALRWVFAISLIPGLIATAVLWGGVAEVRSKTQEARSKTEEDRETGAGGAALPRGFYVFLAAVGLFALGNSSDLFLVLYAQERLGLGAGSVIGLWVMLHLAKIAFSLPGGRFSDRFGKAKSILIGWFIYMAVYGAMPFAGGLVHVIGLLIVYGAYYGMTEGAERALVADYVPAAQRGWAFGLYHAVVAMAALPASLLFGVLFAKAGPTAAFLTGAALAAGATGVLSVVLVLGQRRSSAQRGEECA